MTDLQMVRRMADHVSVYLYCVAHIPVPLNQAWLDWVDRGKIPTEEQWTKILYKSQAWEEAYRKTYGYKLERLPECNCRQRLNRGSYINTAIQEANQAVEHIKLT